MALGERKEFSENAFRDAVRGASQALKDLEAAEAAVFLVEAKVNGRPLSWNVRQAVLGMREALYRFDQLKSQKKANGPALERVTLVLSANAQLEQALAEAQATADGADLARTLGNLPSNICTPTYLAEEAKKLARQFKLQVEVLERRDMERLGMGAFLAVANASHQPPKLIVLRYAGARQDEKAARARRQGHHLRHRRHLAQARGRDGRDEVRHVRRRRPCSAPSARSPGCARR